MDGAKQGARGAVLECSGTNELRAPTINDAYFGSLRGITLLLVDINIYCANMAE